MLASCSVDNTVAVWSAEKSFQLLTVLRDAQTLVKGVTWDPIGKFLAAQDDKSLRIWRTSDWKLEKVLVDHFDKVGALQNRFWFVRNCVAGRQLHASSTTRLTTSG